jgi:hypothetical protein
VDETYRMLGREHQADLEREAQRRDLAAAARAARRAPRQARRSVSSRWLRLLPGLSRLSNADVAATKRQRPISSHGVKGAAE